MSESDDATSASRAVTRSPEAAEAIIGAVDVHYRDDGSATAALVVFDDPADEEVTFEGVAHIAETAAYEPGSLYLRELPCIAAVLELGPPLDLLIVDGYATLDPDGRAGLGARAYDEFGVPTIGVAKTPFRTATHAVPVTRGTASRPLYVTTAGTDTTQAALMVASMAGNHRIPTLLARVDRLARGS